MNSLLFTFKIIYPGGTRTAPTRTPEGHKEGVDTGDQDEGQVPEAWIVKQDLFETYKDYAKKTPKPTVFLLVFHEYNTAN